MVEVFLVNAFTEDLGCGNRQVSSCMMDPYRMRSCSGLH